MSVQDAPPKELVTKWETLAVDETLLLDGSTGESPWGATHKQEMEPLGLERRSLKSLPRISLTTSAAQREVGGESFRVKAVLGEGGMGVVELATQQSLYRDVALKKVKGSLGDNEKAGYSLLREAWVTGLLEHPNIIPVHSIGTDQSGRPLMVMKVVEGVSWAECFEKPSKLPGYRAGKEVLELHLQVLLQVCNALDFAHSKGILHRDLKPENVMIGGYGEIYVVDWGLAVTMRDDQEGRLPLAREANQICGTPAYMPPEMAEGNGALMDERTDVYLLGALLHEIMTGRGRHEGKSLPALLHKAYLSLPVVYGEEVPEELGAIANRATAREREERFASVRAFREALEDYLTHRESYRLGDEGEERLEELEVRGKAFADGYQGEEEIPGALFALFWEGRFALEQALRIWAGNQEACRVRERLLVAMGELHLLVGDERGLTQRLEELEEAPAFLVEGLEALRRRREAQDAEFSQLKRFQKALDIDIASGARSKFAFALGAIFGVLPILQSGLIRLGLTEFTITSYMIQWGVVVAVVGGLSMLFRKHVMRNRINRTIILAVFGVILGMGLMRGMAIVMGLDVYGLLAMSKSALAMGLLMMAATIDKRLGWTALIFFVGAVLVGLFPAWGLEFDGLSTLAGFWVMAFMWHGRNDD